LLSRGVNVDLFQAVLVVRVLFFVCLSDPLCWCHRHPCHLCSLLCVDVVLVFFSPLFLFPLEVSHPVERVTTGVYFPLPLLLENEIP